MSSAPSNLLVTALLATALVTPGSAAADDARAPTVSDLRLEAEQRIRDGEGGDPGSGAYEEGARLYLKIWTDHGEAACKAKQPACERMEEILYNAARAFQAARLIPQAIAARKILVDPQYHLDHTELARKALYEIGEVFVSMGVYDEAATWFEAFAREAPKIEKAPDALTDAIVLRLGLGQMEKASDNAAFFEKVYGAKRPADVARLRFALGAHALEHGDLAGAKRRLATGMQVIDKSGPIDVRIRAHAALGRVLSELRDEAAAAAEYEKVRRIFASPAKVIHDLEAIDGGSGRALGTALTALGEATFFFAEQKRKAAEAITRPVHDGSGLRADVLRYTQTALPLWLVKRRAAMEEAEKAYLEVLGIEPSPPPKWVVTAAATVARMHGRLAAEIRSAPAPRAWKKSGPSPFGQTWEGIRAAYLDDLDQASEPERQRAKGAYRRCVDLSVKYQYTDTTSRACGQWLSRHYPAEFPRIDEIIDAPSHVGAGLERPAPLPEPPAARGGARTPIAGP